MFETQSDEVEDVSWFHRWLPLLVSIGFTPIAILFVGVTSMEGDYFYPNLVFPYSMVSARFFRWISFDGSRLTDSIVIGTVLGLLIAQFPIYGLILSWAKRRDVTILILIGVHACFAIVAFILSAFTAVH
jgi:hypothetical protein